MMALERALSVHPPLPPLPTRPPPLPLTPPPPRPATPTIIVNIQHQHRRHEHENHKSASPPWSSSPTTSVTISSFFASPSASHDDNLSLLFRYWQWEQQRCIGCPAAPWLYCARPCARPCDGVLLENSFGEGPDFDRFAFAYQFDAGSRNLFASMQTFRTL